MKFSIAACLLATLTFATLIAADATQEEAAQITPAPAPQIPDVEFVDDQAHVALREVVGQDPAATQGPLQVSPITTVYLPQQGQAAWVPIAYTQTFPPFPGQLSSAVAGEIGWGTLKQAGASKREAQAEPAPTAAVPSSPTTSTLPPAVLAMRTVGVTQWVHPVEEVVEYLTMQPSPALSSILGATPPDITLPNITFSNTTLPNVTLPNVTFPHVTSPFGANMTGLFGNATNITAFGNGSLGILPTGSVQLSSRAAHPQSPAYNWPRI